MSLPAATLAPRSAIRRYFLGRRAAPAWIGLLALPAFLPALHCGFVWDDEQNLLSNPHIRDLDWNSLRWMWSTNHLGHYQPLSWMSLGLDRLFWGMNPAGYHLTNLLLHAANAALFYFLALDLLRLTLPRHDDGASPALRLGAGFSALFFALHPLRVESVVWITERRDVLSGAFFLATLLCYLRACPAADVRGDGQHRPRRFQRAWFYPSLLCYVLCLLSKASGMTLPAALLILDAYPLRRSFGEARLWREKAPFCLLALLAAMAAVASQYTVGDIIPLADHGIPARLAQAGHGLLFYVSKTALPADLSPFYPFPEPFHPGSPRFILRAAAAAGISAICVLRARRGEPWWLAVWAYYAATLMPVLGLVQNGLQFTADRYSYLSCLGWALLPGAGVSVSWLGNGRGNATRGRVLLGSAACALAVLGGLTWRQIRFWRDPVALWSRSVELGPSSNVSRGNLGTALYRRERWDEAAIQYERALLLNPRDAKSLYGMSFIAARRGDDRQRVREPLLRASRIEPRNAGKARLQLGDIHASRGLIPESIRLYEEALRFEPGSARAHNNLGAVLAQSGKLEEGILRFREAVRLDPKDAGFHGNLERALAERAGRRLELPGGGLGRSLPVR